MTFENMGDGEALYDDGSAWWTGTAQRGDLVSHFCDAKDPVVRDAKGRGAWLLLGSAEPRDCGAQGSQHELLAPWVAPTHAQALVPSQAFRKGFIFRFSTNHCPIAGWSSGFNDHSSSCATGCAAPIFLN